MPYLSVFNLKRGMMYKPLYENLQLKLSFFKVRLPLISSFFLVSLFLFIGNLWDFSSIGIFFLPLLYIGFIGVAEWMHYRFTNNAELILEYWSKSLFFKLKIFSPVFLISLCLFPFFYSIVWVATGIWPTRWITLEIFIPPLLLLIMYCNYYEQLLAASGRLPIHLLMKNVQGQLVDVSTLRILLIMPIPDEPLNLQVFDRNGVSYVCASRVLKRTLISNVYHSLTYIDNGVWADRARWLSNEGGGSMFKTVNVLGGIKLVKPEEIKLVSQQGSVYILYTDKDFVYMPAFEDVARCFPTQYFEHKGHLLVYKGFDATELIRDAFWRFMTMVLRKEEKDFDGL